MEPKISMRYILRVAKSCGAKMVIGAPDQLGVAGNDNLKEFFDKAYETGRLAEREDCLKECTFGRSSADIELAILARNRPKKEILAEKLKDRIAEGGLSYEDIQMLEDCMKELSK